MLKIELLDIQISLRHFQNQLLKMYVDSGQTHHY
jgi:hypothetical protein